MRTKDFPEGPKTLGEHLRKRRKELGLMQREAATRMGVGIFTLISWEKDRTAPVASRFRPVLDFLGYDPMREPTTLVERVQAVRRCRGLTYRELAAALGWDEGTLSRYLAGTWRMPAERAAALEQFLCADVAARRRTRTGMHKR